MHDVLIYFVEKLMYISFYLANKLQTNSMKICIQTYPVIFTQIFHIASTILILYAPHYILVNKLMHVILSPELS